MPNLNRVFLMGHLTDDARLDGAGSALHLAATLAVNESWRNREGREQSRVDYLELYVKGERGANLAPHLKKGRAVLVEGRLRKNVIAIGEAATTSVEIVRVEFLGPNKEGR